MNSTPPRPPRADSVKNRARILAAARTCIHLNGPDVAMTAIAAHAGVAVGTLYRHFPNKADLVAAVLGEYLDGITADAQIRLDRIEAGESAPQLFEEFLAYVVDRTATVHAIKKMAEKLDDDRLPADQERGALAVVEALLIRARDAGHIAPGITIDDLNLLIHSAPLDKPAAERARWLELVRSGLLARPVAELKERD